ncbi:MAG: hypothetical protein ACREKF_08760, partial [Candidatus Methylomirabilales bacterium]
RKLDRYLYAQFQALSIYEKHQRMFVDACVFGTGFLHWYLSGPSRKLAVDRILPDEVIVDNKECLSTLVPREMTHRTLVHRSYLLRKYPEYETQIQAAQGSNFAYTSYRTPDQNRLVLMQTWRTACDGEPGRHVVCIESATLLDEPYNEEYHPFTTFRWSDPLSGYYGIPLVEEILPHQLRLDQLNEDIQDWQDTSAHPRVFLDAASQIVQSHLDADSRMRVVKVRGRKPEVDIWPAVSPELYAERERVASRPYQLAGISEMSASSNMPEGTRLDSSRAIREASQVGDRRFALQSQRLEKTYLTSAQMIINMSAKSGQPQKVTWRTRRAAEDIDWDAAMADQEHLVLILEASSIQNETPAGRLEAVDDMVAKGIFTPEEVKAMYQNPDVESELDLQAAAVEDINATIEEIQDGGQPTPDPLSNLTLAIPRIHKAYLSDKRAGAPQEILDDYQVWIETAIGIRDGIGQPTPNPVPGSAPLPGAMDPSMMAPGMLPPPGPPPGLPAPIPQ